MPALRNKTTKKIYYSIKLGYDEAKKQKSRKVKLQKIAKSPFFTVTQLFLSYDQMNRHIFLENIINKKRLNKRKNANYYFQILYIYRRIDIYKAKKPLA